MMPAMSDRISLSIADDVATIRLARAEVRNAIDPAWIEALADAIAAAAAPGAARAILIVADGPHFTVGGDLGHFAAAGDRLGDELRDMVGTLHDALAALAEAPVPVVTGARGAAAGGGLGLLWAADIVVAGDDLKLATGFSRIGLTGDGGWSYYLPRLVGIRRAQELILENRMLGAAEALDLGLVTRVVAAADVADEAAATARRLAAGPTVSLGVQRRLLRESWDVSLREALTAERDAMAAMGATADAREGVASFLERRDPRFAGR